MGQSRIAVSVTSLPDRLDGLQPVMDSLRRQTLKPDHLHLWLCPYYKRLKLPFSLDRLPAHLHSQGNRPAIELVEDWGPLTKLYPAIQRYAQTETILVILDDDRIVPSDFLATLVDACLETGAVCGFRGRKFRRPSYRYRETELVSSQSCWCPTPFQCTNSQCSETEHFSACAPKDRRAPLTAPVPVDILTGTGGIAFPAGVMNEDFLNFWKLHALTHESVQWMVDDIWINGYLAMKGVPRYVIPSASLIETHGFRQPDSLAKVNVGSHFNDQSIEVFADSWSKTG